MFNENITFFRKNLAKTSESEYYAGSLYIDETWNLGYFGATIRRQHQILVASCYQHLTGRERL
jgi:hypothetical protein